jgi:hypothetical protein
MMQYFGYLRRDPQSAPDSDLSDYNFWLFKLNSFKGDFHKAEMVKAFLGSIEYRTIRSVVRLLSESFYLTARLTKAAPNYQVGEQSL